MQRNSTPAFFEVSFNALEIRSKPTTTADPEDL
jgi:hypothetical protein